jgi:hypothetical protein
MKFILLFILSFLVGFQSFSQSEEFGMFFGTSYYIGDLNPNKHFDQNMNPALGIMYKRNDINMRYAYRFHFMYGKIEAYDIQADDPWQRNRNLNFSSTVLEIAAIIEVNFMKFRPGNVTKLNQTPYLFFGIAGYNFRPQGLYNDRWYDLQALGTEGQGTSENPNRPYRLNQFAIPIGFGFKKNLNQDWAFAIEYGARILFTDYLDDVSGKYANPTVLADEAGVLTPILADRSYQQDIPNNVGADRGNSLLKDWYFFAGITLSYSFNKGDECTNAFKRKE